MTAVMKYSSLIIFIAIFFLPGQNIMSQPADSQPHGFPKTDPRGSESENFSSRDAVFEISSNKTRYGQNERIPLKLVIKNRGFHPLTIYLHRNILRNFTMVVRHPSGKSLPVKAEYYHDDTQDYRDPFFYNYTATNFHSRSITIQPGESFKRIMYLDDMVELSQVQEKKERFIISGYFYPNPEQSPALFLPSLNKFTVYRDNHHYKPVDEIISEQAPEFSPRRPGLDPKEVVFLTLSAEYTADWPNYFKYMSLREIIRDYPEFARNYMLAEDYKKPSVLDSFRRYIMQRETHKLVKFKVVKEETTDRGHSNRSTAQVQVKAVRKIDGFKREFLYTYYLSQHNDLWLVTGIQSQAIQ